VGETRTQVVAQLEADIAFLMPSDRHGQETLTKRLKNDLVTLKGLVESGVGVANLGGVSSKQLSGRSSSMSAGATVSPATIAGRIRRRAPEPHPGAGWGTGAGTESGSAPMGGTTPGKDGWGDGMVNEEDRGSAHDY
jgi:hypothetical protein